MARRARAGRVSTLKATLRPLTGDSHRRASVDIHQYLRDLILSNALPPETILSQVEVADCLKVSRTPVREALRMLMEEGLVKAEPNYRCRVLGFDPRELEALYVSRIANEGIAAAVTVQSMTDSDIKKLAELLHELGNDERPRNLRRWLKNHRTFHGLLFCRANPLLQKRMLVDCQRSERYIYNTVQAGLTDLFRRAAIEHEKIYEACKRRQPATVVALLTDHLAAAAIDIMAEFAPDWEPTTLRNAILLMHRGAAHLDKA
ncbi:MAG TPA: GntR family transcriptional regulator [Pseudolabrys sp.]|nr:GntR family transcriptional regulator [Pseudolabrys sp.]